jgi:putative sensory transduction regulator
MADPELDPDPALPPLAIARVAALLDAQGAQYGIDDDGDLYAAWDSHPFWFMTVGPDKSYLQVRGRWSHTAPRTELGALLIACNEWSQQMLWPKLYVRADAEGAAVFAEHTVTYERGVTDAQLDLHLSTSIGSTLGFFRELAVRFPAAVAPSAPPALHDPARPTAE